jgi:rod shape-determining protein MreC
MRNVFLFIRRYRTFFVFLILQGVALWFLFSYNRFHRAKGLGFANELTGWVNAKYNFVEDYFTLREENKRVHKLNDSLMNQLPGFYGKRDTTVFVRQDSIAYDTLGHYRRYYSRSAIAVYNTVNSQKNYIQLNRGSNQGIKDNMAVLDSDGSAVGVVINVSPNFSQAMSLLHVQHKVNASLKKSSNFGTAEWDGKDPRYLLLKGIPQSVKVNKGDTVVTSAYSFNFPAGHLVGFIDDIIKDKSTNFYMLKIKTAANFFNLHQVHVIENLERDEQWQLMQDTKNKIEQGKKMPK